MGANNKPILIALGAVAVLVVAYLAYVGLTSDDEAGSTIVQQPVPVPAEIEEPAVVEPPPMEVIPDPMIEPEVTEEEVAQTPDFMLPRLSESDDLFRDGMVSVTDHSGMVNWLGADDLIRKFVMLVDNIAKGSLPRQHLGFLDPGEPFQVQRETEKTFVLDANSYRRFDLVTEIFVSVESRRAVEFYNLLRPLFQKAYEELGYRDRKFDDVIFVAIGRILETPTLTQPPRLVRPAVMYEFADKRLENLSDAQKQLIRMGPENTRVVQAKLSEFALELRSLVE